jgi:malate dehydrogenase (oxaloacetate-decarboxylating)
MCVAAADELAKFAEQRGINERDISARMEEWEVYPRVAVACALESIKEGIARIKPSRQELWDRAVAIIKNARDSTQLLMKNGLIRAPPSEEQVLKGNP